MLKKIVIPFLFFSFLFGFGCVATQQTPSDETNTKQEESKIPSASEITPIIEEEPFLDPEPVNAPPWIVHNVKYDGETLSLIAKWYTGSYHNWERLAKFNPEINPNLLYLNSNILIPDELIITIESMPKKFVDQFFKKNSQKKIEKSQTPDENDTLQLFGPKTNQKE